MESDSNSLDDSPFDLSEEKYEQAIETLRDFDLSPVSEQLWDEGVEDVDSLEAHFRRFIKYVLDNPYEKVAPSPAVDQYWHKFILNTKLYHEFCDQIFGEYLHHTPNTDHGN